MGQYACIDRLTHCSAPTSSRYPKLSHNFYAVALELIRSHLRDASALSCLLILLAAATLIAISIAVVVVTQGRRRAIDWHSQRGLSFLQLGLREIKRLCYQPQGVTASPKGIQGSRLETPKG